MAGGDTFFHQKIFLKKPNTSECAQVLVVTWVKLDCVEALLSPPPTTSHDMEACIVKHTYNQKEIIKDVVLGYVTQKSLLIKTSVLFNCMTVDTLPVISAWVTQTFVPVNSTFSLLGYTDN